MKQSNKCQARKVLLLIVQSQEKSLRLNFSIRLKKISQIHDYRRMVYNISIFSSSIGEIVYNSFFSSKIVQKLSLLFLDGMDIIFQLLTSLFQTEEMRLLSKVNNKSQSMINLNQFEVLSSPTELQGTPMTILPSNMAKSQWRVMSFLQNTPKLK